MLYVSPCFGPNKLDGRQQIKDLFTNLGANRTKTFNRVWINVETNPYSQCALSKGAETCNIVTNMIDEITKQGKTAGIYSNIFMWNYYMEGGQCSNLASNTAVWYPHDDKLPNFYDYNDFAAFGPWTTYKNATIKQFKLDSSLCSISGNVNQLNMQFNDFDNIKNVPLTAPTYIE